MAYRTTADFDLRVDASPNNAKLSGLTTGDRAFVVAVIGGIYATDALAEAVFTAKLSVDDPDDAPTTIQKLIPSADGDAARLPDGRVVVRFLLDRVDTVALETRRVYDIRVWVVRDGVTYDRTIQTGSIVAELGVTTLSADPEFTAVLILAQPGAQLAGVGASGWPVTLAQLGGAIAAASAAGFLGTAQATQSAPAVVAVSSWSVASSGSLAQLAGALAGAGGSTTRSTGATTQAGAAIASTGGQAAAASGAATQGGGALAGVAPATFKGPAVATQSGGAVAGVAGNGAQAAGGVTQAAGAVAAVSGLTFPSTGAPTQTGAAAVGVAVVTFPSSAQATQAAGAIVGSAPGVLILESLGRLKLQSGAFLILE